MGDRRWAAAVIGIAGLGILVGGALVVGVAFNSVEPEPPEPVNVMPIPLLAPLTPAPVVDTGRAAEWDGEVTPPDQQIPAATTGGETAALEERLVELEAQVEEAEGRARARRRQAQHQAARRERAATEVQRAREAALARRPQEAAEAQPLRVISDVPDQGEDAQRASMREERRAQARCRQRCFAIGRACEQSARTDWALETQCQNAEATCRMNCAR